jgi:hypothetical protein
MADSSIIEYGAPHGGRAFSRLSLSRAGIFSRAALPGSENTVGLHSIPAATFRPPWRKAVKTSLVSNNSLHELVKVFKGKKCICQAVFDIQIFARQDWKARQSAVLADLVRSTFGRSSTECECTSLQGGPAAVRGAR